MQETGEKRMMGIRRQVPVITKDKRRLTCELKLSQIEVAGEKLYIGLLHDITEFRRKVWQSQTPPTSMVTVLYFSRLHYMNTCKRNLARFS
jgi:hypothetical protein